MTLELQSTPIFRHVILEAFYKTSLRNTTCPVVSLTTTQFLTSSHPVSLDSFDTSYNLTILSCMKLCLCIEEKLHVKTFSKLLNFIEWVQFSPLCLLSVLQLMTFPFSISHIDTSPRMLLNAAHEPSLECQSISVILQ